ncbi:MAG TPA: response regulator [Polyangia bacterium]|nr:response regulator [Polyangia bacterium]
MRRLRLLIVDDEPDMLDFLERVFRHEYDVLRAQSGEEALQALAQAEVDILLTDQKMPRMTGIQLLEAIKDRHPDLVRVLISGYTDVPDIQHAVERCQIHQYVVKPVDSDRLRQAVREACERRTTSDWTFTLGRERD